jgi:LPS sulfotransferase NodH
MAAREKLLTLRDGANSAYTFALQRTYFRLFGHQVDQRFMIVANARTGSNYLLDGLKTAPAIRTYHEIFAPHIREMGRDFEKILSTIYQYESKSTQMVGFKVFYNHLTDEEWKKLAARTDLKVIHLTRRNRLRTVVSLEIAFKTGRWTQSGNSAGLKEKRIKLDQSKLLKRLEQIKEGEVATRARFSDRSMLEIVYEELVRSPHNAFATVGAYLGIDGIDPGKIRLKRQNPESLAQLIANYDEVESLLKNTGFSEYLVDGAFND